MNRLRSKVTPWLCAAALLLPAFALAQDMHHAADMPEGPGMMHEHGHGHEGHEPAFMRRLHLDEAQQDKIFAIHHAQEPAMRLAARAARKAHDELNVMAKSGKFDEAKAKALSDTAARSMADMALMRARSTAQIYAVLNDEQRKQMAEMDDQSHAHSH